MTEERVVTMEMQTEDVVENSLRPLSLAEFIGQKAARENLNVFVNAARARGDALDHVLLYGPPGLGKTTLAQIVAKEMGVNFRTTSGPLLTKAGDLAAILTNLQEKDVLFIDEIHRLNPIVEEVLYPAMEDFKLDLIIGEGPAARTIRIDIPKFTLVGATTRIGLIANPLRDRFGIPVRLNFYDTEELRIVIERAAGILNVKMTADGSDEIARRSRGTPRIAVRLLKRVRDFAEVDGSNTVDKKIADKALSKLEVDDMGLDSLDHRYIKFIAEKYAGGPVGIETVAAALSEQRDALEETVEPFLIQKGLLQRTPRGRVLTVTAFKQLGIKPPINIPALQQELMENEDA